MVKEVQGYGDGKNTAATCPLDAKFRPRKRPVSGGHNERVCAELSALLTHGEKRATVPAHRLCTQSEANSTNGGMPHELGDRFVLPALTARDGQSFEDDTLGPAHESYCTRQPSEAGPGDYDARLHQFPRCFQDPLAELPTVRADGRSRA